MNSRRRRRLLTGRYEGRLGRRSAVGVRVAVTIATRQGRGDRALVGNAIVGVEQPLHFEARKQPDQLHRFRARTLLQICHALTRKTTFL